MGRTYYFVNKKVPYYQDFFLSLSYPNNKDMSKDNEIFLPIQCNENYQISNLGRVKRLGSHKGKGHPISDKIIKGSPCLNGYWRVAIKVNSILKTIKIHQLVAQHFIPNPENKNTVNHKDGNKANNHVDNLEWCTYAENNIHAYKTGLKDNKGDDNGRSKLSNEQVIEIYYAKGRQVDIAKKYGVSQAGVSSIKIKKTWAHLTKYL